MAPSTRGYAHSGHRSGSRGPFRRSIAAKCGYLGPKADLVAPAGARSPADVSASPEPDRENSPVDLVRFSWLAVVAACLIAVLVLVLDGYYGYAIVTLAVAASAAINLR
jgi:hypothetical protein